MIDTDKKVVVCDNCLRVLPIDPEAERIGDIHICEFCDIREWDLIDYKGIELK